MRSLIVLFFIVQTLAASSQTLEAYKLFSQDGQEIDFGQLVNQLSDADVVLFGEQHNNAICHWLQIELTKALDAKRDIILGAEMFESDDQLVLNEYLSGTISESRFKEEVKLWNNYKTDYAPLIEYAKANSLKFIATNIPKRYASLVSVEGQEALLKLNKEAKSLFPKMPFEVTPGDKGYAEMRMMMGGHVHGGSMDIDKLIEAQASKDYTMAHFINENRQKDQLFVHYNGSFHSKLDGGIVGYLKAMNKKLKVVVITSLAVEELELLEDQKEQGDYILLILDSVTKTY